MSWRPQAARFAAVGVAAAGLDWAVLRALGAAGVSPFVARGVSLAVAVVFTWALNRRFTFATPVPPSWREFAVYVAASLIGLTVNYALYAAALAGGAPLWLAFAAGTGAGAVFNFWRYRRLLG